MPNFVKFPESTEMVVTFGTPADCCDIEKDSSLQEEERLILVLRRKTVLLELLY